jgi:hypothetical protein
MLLRKIREKMEKTASYLHSAPYFFVFFFLWAFATACFTSKRFELASLDSQRIRCFHLKDNRLLKQLGLVNINHNTDYRSIVHVRI